MDCVLAFEHPALNKKFLFNSASDGDLDCFLAFKSLALSIEVSLDGDLESLVAFAELCSPFDEMRVSSCHTSQPVVFYCRHENGFFLCSYFEHLPTEDI